MPSPWQDGDRAERSHEDGDGLGGRQGVSCDDQVVDCHASFDGWVPSTGTGPHPPPIGGPCRVMHLGGSAAVRRRANIISPKIPTRTRRR